MSVHVCVCDSLTVAVLYPPGNLYAHQLRPYTIITTPDAITKPSGVGGGADGARNRRRQ